MPLEWISNHEMKDHFLALPTHQASAYLFEWGFLPELNTGRSAQVLGESLRDPSNHSLCAIRIRHEVSFPVSKHPSAHTSAPDWCQLFKFQSSPSRNAARENDRYIPDIKIEGLYMLMDFQIGVLLPAMSQCSQLVRVNFVKSFLSV